MQVRKDVQEERSSEKFRRPFGFWGNGFRGRMRGASVHFRGGFDGTFEKLSWCRLCLQIAAVGQTAGRKVFAGKAHAVISYSKGRPNIANILNFKSGISSNSVIPMQAGVHRKT